MSLLPHFERKFPRLTLKLKLVLLLRMRSGFSSNLFKQISSSDSSYLHQPFSDDEIKDAVKNCGSDKALGPDGFTCKLFKKYWDFIHGDIISFVNIFEMTPSIPRGYNSSFFTLVPKVDDLIVIGDFRPISLIGFQYKIIAKVLANRLANVISSIVGEVQMTFIKGREIIDGPLTASGTLNWSFLDSTMSQVGFCHKWRKWIHSFLDLTFASVLGSPTLEFKLHRGLRQGDILSPLLFILEIEALNVAFIEAKNKNFFHGVEVGVNKCVIDDTRSFSVKGLRTHITNTTIDLDQNHPRWNKEERTPFIQCRIAKQVWLDVLRWWNLSDANFSTNNELLSFADHIHLTPNQIGCSNAVIHTTFGSFGVQEMNWSLLPSV
ncbi:hypothetical protein Tco_1225726 [Tanacetum coccineum]